METAHGVRLKAYGKEKNPFSVGTGSLAGLRAPGGLLDLFFLPA